MRLRKDTSIAIIGAGIGGPARLRDVGFAPTSSLNRDPISGKVTNDHPLGRAVEERYGAPYLTLHRGDLHAALAEIVPVDTIIHGKKLVGITEHGRRVTLAFA